MAKKDKSNRRVKKDMLAYLQRYYDPTQYDFEKRFKPKSGQAKVAGLLAAILVYSVGFAASYYGWKFNNVSYDLFVKITWVLMIPSSVVGIFAWLIAYNRVENAVRHEFMKIIRPIEAEHGVIWRFRPLISTFDPGNVEIKKLLQQSEQGQSLELDPEIYANAVRMLFDGVTGSASDKISVEAADEVEENFSKPV